MQLMPSISQRNAAKIIPKALKRRKIRQLNHLPVIRITLLIKSKRALTNILPTLEGAKNNHQISNLSAIRGNPGSSAPLRTTNRCIHKTSLLCLQLDQTRFRTVIISLWVNRVASYRMVVEVRICPRW